MRVAASFESPGEAHVRPSHHSLEGREFGLAEASDDVGVGVRVRGRGRSREVLDVGTGGARTGLAALLTGRLGRFEESVPTVGEAAQGVSAVRGHERADTLEVRNDRCRSRGWGRTTGGFGDPREVVLLHLVQDPIAHVHPGARIVDASVMRV